MQTVTPEFSVVIPICNEQENIPELCRRLTGVMESLCAVVNLPNDRYEIILVDDGSRDASWERIRECHDSDRRVKGHQLFEEFRSPHCYHRRNRQCQGEYRHPDGR